MIFTGTLRRNKSISNDPKEVMDVSDESLIIIVVGGDLEGIGEY